MRVNGILSLFSFCDVCSADCRQLLVRDDGPRKKQKPDTHVCLRKSHISSDFKGKSESSLERRPQSLRN